MPTLCLLGCLRLKICNSVSHSHLSEIVINTVQSKIIHPPRIYLNILSPPNVNLILYHSECTFKMGGQKHFVIAFFFVLTENSHQLLYNLVNSINKIIYNALPVFYLMF